MWPFLFSNVEPRVWALVISAILIGAALINPQILKPAYKIWMRIGAILGWINTRIILAICFYAIIFPIGLVMKALGKDPILKSCDPTITTYRINRQLAPSHQMTKQF